MAYVDPSALTPTIFGELPAETRIRLERFPILVSSTLLDAELRATFRHWPQSFSPSLASVIDRWVLPNRRLDEELATVSEIVSLPALPLWHLASAMYFQQRQSLTGRQFRLAFITLDEQQETAARELGFFIPSIRKITIPTPLIRRASGRLTNPPPNGLKHQTQPIGK